MVPFNAKMSEYARGNSHECRLGLLRCSVRSWACPCRQGGHEARPVGPWANGRRQGVPTYVSVAPLALGGVSAPSGANPRADVGPINNDTEVTR